MEGNYEILLGGEPVGQAVVTKQGLYYHFSCRCRFTGAVMFQLQLRWEEKWEHLGIPAPEGEDFCLETRLSAKRMGPGRPEIIAVPRHESMPENFYPVSPEEPFAYLSRLKDGFLTYRDGKPGLSFRDRA